MGSISKAIQKATGKEDKNEVINRLKLLQLAAKSNIAKYKQDLQEGFRDPSVKEKETIPGIRAIRYIEQYHVASSSTFASDAVEHTKKAIKAFFSIGSSGSSTKEQVQEGVLELVTAGLSAFIGSTTVGESTEQMYMIIPENNAFVRVDIFAWKYQMVDSAITTNQDTASAYILCKSVVDHTKLKLDELIYLASEALVTGATTPPLDVVHAAYPVPSGTFLFDEASTDFLDGAKVLKNIDNAGQGKGRFANGDYYARTVSVLKTEPPLPNPDGTNGGVLITAKEKDNGTWLDLDGSDKYLYPTSKYVLWDPEDPAQQAGSPPSIGVVEAYLDELIRVWNKLKDETKNTDD